MENNTKKWVTVLGATGSIGSSTLDVIARHPDRLGVFAISAATQVDKMLELCRQHQPRYAAMASAPHADKLREQCQAHGLRTEVLAAEAGLLTLASYPDVDVVMAAIVGAAGLAPCLAAAQAGKRLLLANKEALVMGGQVFLQAVQQSKATLLPIDSEHSAIFQSLPHDPATWQERVEKIILTASGGPFRTLDPQQFKNVTPEQACAHPNWSMGRKISVDSASMMNKGLELIEACWLFDATPAQIEVVVHPQSVIHSLVDYVDGSVLAQLGNPDMRTPISHALAWPERIDSGVAPLDLFAIARLDFQAPDEQRFPCLRLAREAAQAGGTAPAMLNAANEVAVAAFLERRIRFPEIASMIEDVLHTEPALAVESLDTVLAADSRARDLAEQWLSRR